MAAAGESHGSSRRMYRTDSCSFLRRITGRSQSSQQLLLMEAVGGVTAFTHKNGRNDDDDDDDDMPLPGYERLSQSMRSPEDPDPIDRKRQKQKQKQKQVQKLMQYVFARRGGEEGDDDDAEAAAAKTEEERRRKKKKKRSSWLPDPEKRWPIQGWG
uniref:Uncharacterized protein n=1 Tax=Ananas comosus var. bracteatus TaxID=296719 RepID=A0A6V7NIF0_ANACO|nr:unnamed protein product [Ananas comosus var. bracteatus]